MIVSVAASGWRKAVMDKLDKAMQAMEVLVEALLVGVIFGATVILLAATVISQ